MSDLVDKAIDAAGGMARWREIETIDARLSLTGGLFNIKGLGGIENILMHVETGRPAVDTSPYGSPTAPARWSRNASIPAPACSARR
jgi:hypothetical protein